MENSIKRVLDTKRNIHKHLLINLPLSVFSQQPQPIVVSLRPESNNTSKPLKYYGWIIVFISETIGKLQQPTTNITYFIWKLLKENLSFSGKCVTKSPLKSFCASS